MCCSVCVCMWVCKAGQAECSEGALDVPELGVRCLNGGKHQCCPVLRTCCVQHLQESLLAKEMECQTMSVKVQVSLCSLEHTDGRSD